MLKKFIFASSMALALAVGSFLLLPNYVQASDLDETSEVSDIIPDDISEPESDTDLEDSESIEIEPDTQVKPSTETEEVEDEPEIVIEIKPEVLPQNVIKAEEVETMVEAAPLFADNYPTVYNGVDYSSVYNFLDYINRYPDLKAAFQNDPEGALSHFVNFGMNERRMGNKTFDVRSYMNQYSDLRSAFGSNYASYYIHYINHGKNENRATSGCNTLKNPINSYGGVNYSSVYDFLDYINRYPDLKAAFGDNDIAALMHFINWGMNERRMGNKTFDVMSYMRQYADLRLAFGSNYSSYYLHYINYGKNEGRATSGCKTLQNPISKFNGVDYSKVYDYNYYINKYSDLKKAFADNDISALLHFINFGMNEQRQASASFNEMTYRYSYPDLRNAFRLNYVAYYNHYMNFGYKEGRKATGTVTAMVNPRSSYDYVDFSNIYDYNYYKNYSDLRAAFKDDDISLFEHFLRFGINEGRLAKSNVSPASASYNDRKQLATSLFNAPTSYLGFDLSSIYSYGYYVTHHSDIAKAFGYDARKVFLHFLDNGMFEGRLAKPGMNSNTATYKAARENYRPYRFLYNRLSSAIFVGDSRTRDMNNAVNMYPFTVYGNSGSGFAHIKNVIDSNPGRLALVWSGFNDPHRYQEYINYYRSHYGNIIFLTVGAMDDALAAHAWKWGNVDSYGASFNQHLASAKLPTIDVYTFTKNNGPQTHDGVHYTPSFSQQIFNYIKSALWL